MRDAYEKYARSAVVPSCRDHSQSLVVVPPRLFGVATLRRMASSEDHAPGMTRRGRAADDAWKSRSFAAMHTKQSRTFRRGL